MTWTIFLPTFALGCVLFFHFLFYNWKKKAWRNFKINRKRPANKIQRREQQYSLISLVIFALAGWGLDALERQGWTQTYDEIDGLGYLYLIPSLFIAFFIHDAYFYWSHRFLHIPFIYKTVHIWHHKFNNPTPFTAFAFHPIEAVIQIGIVLVVAVVMPIHIGVLVFFAGFLLAMSVYGHCGYEMRANKKGIFLLFNTSIHHYQHHKYVRYNFGIYMNMWDRLMRTNHPSYPAALQKFWKETQQREALDLQEGPTSKQVEMR